MCVPVPVCFKYVWCVCVRGVRVCFNTHTSEQVHLASDGEPQSDGRIHVRASHWRKRLGEDDDGESGAEGVLRTRALRRIGPRKCGCSLQGHQEEGGHELTHHIPPVLLGKNLIRVLLQ